MRAAAAGPGRGHSTRRGASSPGRGQSARPGTGFLFSTASNVPGSSDSGTLAAQAEQKDSRSTDSKDSSKTDAKGAATADSQPSSGGSAQASAVPSGKDDDHDDDKDGDDAPIAAPRPAPGGLRAWSHPSTAMSVLPSMVPVRVHNHDLRRVLRSVGSRSCSTRRMDDCRGQGPVPPPSPGTADQTGSGRWCAPRWPSGSGGLRALPSRPGTGS